MTYLKYAWPTEGQFIIWEAPSEFNQYVVWPAPNSAVHWFAGWEGQYQQDYCEANPTLCNEGEQ